jgi:hypothetical protein
VCAVAGGGCTFMQRRGWRCWPLLHVPPWTEEAAPSCAAMGGRGCLDSVTMRQSQGRGWPDPSTTCRRLDRRGLEVFAGSLRPQHRLYAPHP